MKSFLITSTIIILFLVVNFILGTSEINNIWQSSSFTCNSKMSSLLEIDICSKKYGLSVWYLLLSIPAIAFMVNLFSKKIEDTFLKSLGAGILWVLVTEGFIRLLKIPALYSWERSSLHYEVFTVVSELKFVLLLMLLSAIFSGILGWVVGKLTIRVFKLNFKSH